MKGKASEGTELFMTALVMGYLMVGALWWGNWPNFVTWLVIGLVFIVIVWLATKYGR